MPLALSVSISVVELLSYCIIAGVTYRHGVADGAKRAFMVYLLSMIGSSMAALLARVDPRPGATLFWVRAMAVPLEAMPLVFYIFVRLFSGWGGWLRWAVIGTIVHIIGLWFNVTGRIVHSASFVNGLLHVEFGSVWLAISLQWPLFIGLAAIALVRAYRGTADINRRNRIKYLLAGLLVVTFGNVPNASATLRGYPIDRAANLANAFLIAYAIIRHQLLDISIFIRKGLLHSIPTAAVAIAYFLIVVTAEEVLRAFVGYQVLLLSIFVAAITAVAVQPVRDRVQLWIDRLFFREKYDAQLMLQELSELAISILDLEELSSLLLDRLTLTMHIKHAYILLREKGTGRFHAIVRKGQTRLQDELIFGEDHPVVQWVASYGQSLTRHDLDVLPQFRALWAEERELLDRLGAELFVPLLVREELIGILILGPKFSEAPYSQDEQLTLTTLANQTAVAIQNAWLYSDLQRSLEELKQIQAQLIQTEKLSAVGEMIAGVAHEINNPLTAVIGYSQLLQMQPLGLDPQVCEDLKQILDAGLRMKRIVANLLDFSRQHRPEKEYLDINLIVSSSLALRINELTNSNIQVQTDLAPDLPWTMADRHQLQQVFVNIINNAQQAMVEKGGPGVLTLSTRRGRNNTILVRFRDTGRGIPKEIMGRIFDPFFTTKEVGKGTGLGLSVSYGIVQEHQGRIWAESDDGRGATFIIELPVRRMGQPVQSGADTMPGSEEGARL